MPLLPGIETLAQDMALVRRDIHMHPEVGFEEFRTADIVSKKLTEWGIEHECGIAGTGIVATLRKGTSERSIGLRADLDALHLTELNEFEHKSCHPGKMHGCGHDGHTAMLLGAAHYLAKNADFDGTVHLIFQPAEEGLGGARKMIEEGLFERFPCDAVFGMHNMANVEPGHFGMRVGAILASSDTWDVEFTGSGGHGAMPHRTEDPVAAAAQFVISLQSIIARSKDALDPAVISVGSIQAGNPGAANVIPSTCRVVGTARAFSLEAQDLMEDGVQRIAQAAADMYRVKTQVRYTRRYLPTINHPDPVALTVEAATRVAGADAVDANCAPVTASEDFSFMAQAVPAAYIYIGNGSGDGGCVQHSPHFDFNDDIIPAGISYWVELVNVALPTSEK